MTVRPVALRLRAVTTRPFNGEAPLDALREDPTPLDAFYVRNNFAPPVVSARDWRLRIGGSVERPLALDIAALEALPAVTRRITLECAGNGRSLLSPPAPGTQWHLGAAGTAVFTGVALADVLAQAGPRDSAVECVFTGADRGETPERGVVPFQRSLPIAVARSRDPLLAWDMNGESLATDHGHPVRLVVPRWYAVASVKWLESVELVDEPFRGHFQADRYVYRKPGEPDRPVTSMRVRSLITTPTADDRLRAGPTAIAGVAWSGEGSIVQVEVSIDGDAWTPARLDAESRVGESVGWQMPVEVELGPGAHRIRARATDSAGNAQPETADWNELGYGNNAIQTVDVSVV